MTNKLIPIHNDLFAYAISFDLKANQRMIEYTEMRIAKEKEFIIRQAFRQHLKALKQQRKETLATLN